MTLTRLRPRRDLGSSRSATERFRNTFSPPLASATTTDHPIQQLGDLETPTTSPAPPHGTTEQLHQPRTSNNITVTTFIQTHEAPDPAGALTHLSQLLEACSNSQYKLSAKGYKRGIECLESIKTHYRYDDAAAPTPVNTTPGTDTVSALHAKVDAIPRLIAEGIEQALASRPLSSDRWDPPHPNPVLPPTERTRQLEFTISIDKVDQKHEVRRAAGKEILTRILDASRAATPHHADLVGVNKLPNGNLVVRTTSAEAKDELIDTAPQWLPSFAPGARLATRSFAIVVQSVSTKLDLLTAPQTIADANPLIPGPTAILGTRWLNERTMQRNKKMKAPLVVFLNDDNLADDLIQDTLIIHGEMHAVNKLIPFPQQCFYCQHFGHLSPSCPAKQRNEPPTCARCALPHLTASCQCPQSPKCPDIRTCQHITPKCANCGGEHRSVNHTCPTKMTETKKILNNPKYSSPYFTNRTNTHSHSKGVPRF